MRCRPQSNNWHQKIYSVATWSPFVMPSWFQMCTWTSKFLLFRPAFKYPLMVRRSKHRKERNDPLSQLVEMGCWSWWSWVEGIRPFWIWDDLNLLGHFQLPLVSNCCVYDGLHTEKSPETDRAFGSSHCRHATYPKLLCFWDRQLIYLNTWKGVFKHYRHRHPLFAHMLNGWLTSSCHPLDFIRGYDWHRAEHALSSGDGTVQMALDLLQAPQKCRCQNVEWKNGILIKQLCCFDWFFVGFYLAPPVTWEEPSNWCYFRVFRF